jgi:maltooligosyltrehalose trehalohydrolase
MRGSGPGILAPEKTGKFSCENNPEVIRRLPVGAEPQISGGVHFRVWAPRRKRVEVVLEGSADAVAAAAYELEREADGYFSGIVLDTAPGILYRFRLHGKDAYPDPASRFQPGGPHGPLQVIDPTKFPWTDENWSGIQLSGQIIYEMHIGTFTREGTWAAAARELENLAKLGIAALEIMPVADFTGVVGWGYDGVDLYAPTWLYGTPDDFRHFVNHAHAAGLAVVLDVVYNHFGPDGAYFKEFSIDYFTDRYENEWGMAINFDGKTPRPCANSLLRMPVIGLTSFTSTAYDSTQPSRFSIRIHQICWRRLPAVLVRPLDGEKLSSSRKTSRSM